MASAVEELIRELIPNSPTLGLHVAPDIPTRKLDNARKDYAGSVEDKDVLALYDATLSGNAKDGAVFMRDRIIFQNNDLSPTQEIRYDDVVGVRAKRKFLGGKKVHVDINRGRATVTFVIDFSGKPDAADFVSRFLYEAMMQSIERESKSDMPSETSGTVVGAVAEALDALVRRGLLSERDREKMLRAIDE